MCEHGYRSSNLPTTLLHDIKLMGFFCILMFHQSVSKLFAFFLSSIFSAGNFESFIDLNTDSFRRDTWTAEYRTLRLVICREAAIAKH